MRVRVRRASLAAFTGRGAASARPIRIRSINRAHLVSLFAAGVTDVSVVTTWDAVVCGVRIVRVVAVCVHRAVRPGLQSYDAENEF